mmetsp:Transcript_1267/g.3906  ORF Transcript_1267/g.3906 Transcript_1267/m.3906 type:complete len:308 (-) Transcript_1267:89-1012(-)|eukprot:CAMPEP_0198730566 /NCGR_PEP_ID=MMETSP1475-20131203/25119_1 /TAXON_ID= ORGANISM="Unidentified sp., Strain CCMP1999" /NCGR_SAMPLE_ID=MMETSP1475 /ASSEMBLY_ACC=CAM_ASM_001111 /LENGTH=307 /DNA_ID=CAMNT_0044493383 /DNA_START=178 /DNA_END=1101 /DNA_ORIENTATION=+
MSRLFVSLRFAASSLAKLDEYSSSDPFVVLYISENNAQAQYTQVGKTTTLRATSDPEFPDEFRLDLKKGVNYAFKAAVYDSDLPDLMISKGKDKTGFMHANEKYLYRKDLVGEATFELDQLTFMTHGRVELFLVKEMRGRTHTRGRLTVCYEEVTHDDRKIILHTKVRGAGRILKQSWDFYVHMYRIRSDGYKMLVQSEKLIFIPSERPDEPDVEFSGTKLCATCVNGDWDARLEFWFLFRVSASTKITNIFGVYNMSFKDITALPAVYRPVAQFRVPSSSYISTLPRTLKETPEMFDMRMKWFFVR